MRLFIFAELVGKQFYFNFLALPAAGNIRQIRFPAVAPLRFFLAINHHYMPVAFAGVGGQHAAARFGGFIG